MARAATAALATLAALAALAVALSSAACGGRELPPATHTDEDARFAFRYDDRAFEEAPLAVAPLLDRAHTAAGYRPSTAVSFAKRGGPDVAAGAVNGFSVAVFPLPPEVREVGLWRLGDQVLPSMMRRIREAVPEAVIDDPRRIDYRDMKGYGTTLRVNADGGPYRVWLFVLVREPFAYEIVMQAREVDVNELRPVFSDLLWSLRTGADLTIR